MIERKVVLYIAMSLDGYIATEGHSLDWLFEAEGEGDNGFSRFYDTVDTILLGKTTYDWIMEHEKENFPYAGKECYVFSRTKRENTDSVFFTDESVSSIVDELKQKDGKSIWIVGGGELLYSFMTEDLVDELSITIAPVLIGKGIPLFRNMDFQTRLTLKDVRRYNQVVELMYDVKK